LTGLAILASSHGSATSAGFRRPRAASLAAGVGNGAVGGGSLGAPPGDASPHSVGSVEGASGTSPSEPPPAVVQSSSLRSGLGGAELQARLASLSLAAQQRSGVSTADGGGAGGSVKKPGGVGVGVVRPATDEPAPDELLLLGPPGALRLGFGKSHVSDSGEWEELRRAEQATADRDDEPFDMEV
jgi:hypothetical protein